MKEFHDLRAQLAAKRNSIQRGACVDQPLRRGPFSTAIPRASAGGLKPEISACSSPPVLAS